MAAKNDGGSAFPQNPEWCSGKGGMTLRDYFAAKAMQGWLASFPEEAEFKDGMEPRIAAFAYRVADAMIEARDKPQRRG